MPVTTNNNSNFDALTFTTNWLGRPREHWAELGSTNDRALAWARAGAPHGALVTADTQTAGRGRLGRPWSSETPGDLYISMILRPGPTASIGALGLAVGVGLREGLARWLPGAQLKWPNDVLASGRKLAGILCEARWVGSSPEIIAGLGINIAREFSPTALEAAAKENPLSTTATSLRRELGPAAPHRSEVLPQILKSIESALDAFFRAGFSAIRGRYEPHCALRDRIILIDTPGSSQKTQARALGLDSDGALLVELEPGAPPHRVESGDVWLAPAP